MTTESSPATIAIDWIDKWSPANAVKTANSRASDLDHEIPRQNPKLCLAAILEILDRIPSDPSDHYFPILAAGPMEDLLINHGKTVIDEVEILARTSIPFRLLLNGVWSPGISKDVLIRISKYRTAPW
jgi:hypothetical protein